MEGKQKEKNHKKNEEGEITGNRDSFWKVARIVVKIGIMGVYDNRDYLGIIERRRFDRINSYLLRLESWYDCTLMTLSNNNRSEKIIESKRRICGFFSRIKSSFSFKLHLLHWLDHLLYNIIFILKIIIKEQQSAIISIHIS